MDRKIKTRQVHKDIKVLDKTVTVTDHVKQVLCQNKRKCHTIYGKFQRQR